MKYIYNQRSYETRGVDGRRRCRSSALYWSRLSSCESGAASYNLGSVVVVELRYSCVFVCFVCMLYSRIFFFFFFQAEDGIRDLIVTGVQTCALPISPVVGVATPLHAGPARGHLELVRRRRARCACGAARAPALQPGGAASRLRRRGDRKSVV